MLIVNCLNIAEIDSDIYSLLRDSASQERRTRADKFYHLDDSKRCICSEHLLRHSLFESTGHCGAIDIRLNQYGKPYVQSVDGFFYNISHCGLWVILGYGETEIGVDVERIREDNSGIAERFFTPSERTYIDIPDEAERGRRFMQLWTLKESYIKYLGTGLSTGLNTFSINVPDGTVTDYNGKYTKDLRLKSMLFDNDYYLSSCSTDNDIIVRTKGLSELL